MAGDLALTGLASGVDTSGIVTKLMQIEQQGRTRLTTKQSQITARESGIKDVQAKLTALKTAATALSDASTWTSQQTVGSSDSSRIGAVMLGATAGAGGTTINVTALASAAQHAYDYTPASGATIQLMRNGSQVGPTVTIDPNTSIKDAAAKINAAGLDVSRVGRQRQRRRHARLRGQVHGRHERVLHQRPERQLQHPLGARRQRRRLHRRRRPDRAPLGLQHGRERDPGRPAHLQLHDARRP